MRGRSRHHSPWRDDGIPRLRGPQDNRRLILVQFRSDSIVKFPTFEHTSYRSIGGPGCHGISGTPATGPQPRDLVTSTSPTFLGFTGLADRSTVSCRAAVRGCRGRHGFLAPLVAALFVTFGTGVLLTPAIAAAAQAPAPTLDRPVVPSASRLQSFGAPAHPRKVDRDGLSKSRGLLSIPCIEPERVERAQLALRGHDAGPNGKHLSSFHTRAEDTMILRVVQARRTRRLLSCSAGSSLVSQGTCLRL